ncbi:Glucocorticoid receptor-like (DNA-binding) [Glarea lozoyensis ATCC 20868]|uniref:Glucocorticoid receptor-like (DNA-binding) n=1 Tax=Glarea lozoyensis (strain ATCC 20868 / MF5171) TaxID=1116229 RepID=S3DKS4_GLAL2|nr:Glucocorticoid receptor-like (DNA-binding) [Glarea lozoyensis ATCC 20868]EPE32661.1 Glucocorticoid receptor-like (DNA-binding) [Glarea lozoyensis ATCC 20868]
MNQYPSTSTGRSSFDSTYQSPNDFTSPVFFASSHTSLDGRETTFDHLQTELRDPWSYTSKHHRSNPISPLMSPGADQLDHDFMFTDERWNSQSSSLDARKSVSAEPWKLENWQIARTEDTVNQCNAAMITSRQNTYDFLEDLVSEQELVGLPGFGYGMTSGLSSSSEEDMIRPAARSEQTVGRHHSLPGYISPQSDQNTVPPRKVAFSVSYECSEEHSSFTEWENPFLVEGNFQEGLKEITTSSVGPQHDHDSLTPLEDACTSWNLSPLTTSNPPTPLHLTNTLPESHTPPKTKRRPPPQTRIIATSPPITCKNCLTHNTPLWRRGADGVPMCNACGLFLRLHGTNRPLSLKTDVIKKRNRGGCGERGSEEGEKGNKGGMGKRKRKRSEGVGEGIEGVLR